MCRCVVRYGYKDITRNDDNEFENQLILKLAEFIQTEGSAPWIPSSSEMTLDGRMKVMGTLAGSFASNTSANSLSEPCSERVTRTLDLEVSILLKIYTFVENDQKHYSALVLFS